jgi:tetratricopeptide (TPR) repeat protein
MTPPPITATWARLISARRQFDKAIQSYSKALELDPDIFERSSHAGVLAKLPSPEDRAHYDYVLAKLYAKTGEPDRSLHYLKKAMEEGYKDIKDVYKDNEFSTLRKDPRFARTDGGEDDGPDYLPKIS